jgi:hypothetical protein
METIYSEDDRLPDTIDDTIQVRILGCCAFLLNKGTFNWQFLAISIDSSTLANRQPLRNR